MAIDEFGREILSPALPLPPPSPRPRSRSYGADDRRSISPSPSSFRRRKRDSDGRATRRDDHRRANRESERSSGGGSYTSSSRDKKRKQQHPSETYCEEALPCQYVWEQQLLAARKEEAGGGDDEQQQHNDETTAEGETADASKPTESEPPLFSSPEEATAAYLAYNTKYCLNYVRTFFNAHLDDQWFRLHLSPSAQYIQALIEKSRCQSEAKELRKEILHSLEERTSGAIPKKDPDCPDYLGPPKCSFVAGCRLGVGVKPVKYNGRGGGDHYHSTPSGDDTNRIDRHAKSHLISYVKSDAVIQLSDVPPYVTSDQLLGAIGKFVDRKEDVLTAVDSPVHIPAVSSSSRCTDEESLLPYHRSVYIVFVHRDAKEGMLDRLHRYNDDRSTSSSFASRNGTRGGERDRLPRILEFDVDCTDVYGRKMIDADGMGGAPPGTNKKDSGIPTKRCRIYVSTISVATSQPVSVLSAAVSSRGRIAGDKVTVMEIAEKLDEVREVARGDRLVDLLRVLYPTEAEWESVDDEDILDVSIAYLRRVHLFSFYNGCVMAKSVGSVLNYSHPVGTIHLRLRNADYILRKMAEDRGEIAAAASADNNEIEMDVDDKAKIEATVANDMLVMRLNDSIEKAFETVNEMHERGPGCLIDEETDAAAKQIEAAEKETKNTWLENHGTMDEDGRARCSFHWCKKLFKDKAFLQKHLLKKHSDHLRSECAKCHDQAMMAAWDKDENRPVPPVLIDCGAKFRKVPSAVVGSAEPMAHDPEPQLWKEEEERMAEEEKRRKEAEEEEARLAEEERQRELRRQEAMAGEKRKSNFVDVDDMVEEKIELKMEDVVVAPPPKKKKKKKSLL